MLALAVAGLSCPPKLAAQPLTLDMVMSAPFPSDLRASHSGEHVVWISNERGVRNIILAEKQPANVYAARAITAYTEDNGFELDQLTWAANDGAIVYTGGGSLEGGGPVNTLSLASGPSAKHVYAVKIGDPTPRDLGLGEDPAASPRDDRIAFIRDGQIWLASLSSAGPAGQIIHDRGTAGSLHWSPDGSKIAFVSQRPEGQSFVGVYDFTSRSVRWISPSADRDSALRWSPDSRRLAWIREPIDFARAGTVDRRLTGMPWSIWVGDAATGDAKAIWRASPGLGSRFKNVEDGTMLFWTAANRLVFPWEQTGWIRLYSVDPEGGKAVPLSPDRSEVFAAQIDDADGSVVFSSNAFDDDHRHLWKASAALGQPRMLTKGDTVEDLPTVTAAGTILALQGSGVSPLEPVALLADGKTAPLYRNEASAGFPRGLMVTPQRVVFNSLDGLKVHGQLFLPARRTPDKRPAILFFHGGPERQMLLGWHPMGAYTHFYAMNQFLTAQGYVVMSVNYRGGTGYGLAWRQPEGFSDGGGTEVRDIAGAVAYLKSRPDVDPTRIGVYGMSYGGLMTSLALSKLPNEFVTGVDIAGVHDWKTFFPYMTAPGADPARAELAFQSSAISSAAQWRAPALLIQGDDDRAVVFSQFIEMLSALRQAGNTNIEQFIIPNEVHDFIRHKSWYDVFDHTQAYLQRHLMQAHSEAER